MTTDAPLDPAFAGQVLDRLTSAAGVRNDTALASQLGVTPQAVANWRKRGVIPFPHLFAFANSSGASMDHLLFGMGPARRGVERVDPHVFTQIATAVHMKEIEEAKLDPRRRLTLAEQFFYAAVIYNRLAPSDGGPGTHSQIQQEVAYVFEIRRETIGADPLEVRQAATSNSTSSAPAQRRPASKQRRRP